jgi:predicted nucleic-acid-binding protein
MIQFLQDRTISSLNQEWISSVSDNRPMFIQKRKMCEAHVRTLFFSLKEFGKHACVTNLGLTLNQIFIVEKKRGRRVLVLDWRAGLKKTAKFISYLRAIYLTVIDCRAVLSFQPKLKKYTMMCFSSWIKWYNFFFFWGVQFQSQMFASVSTICTNDAGKRFREFRPTQTSSKG